LQYLAGMIQLIVVIALAGLFVWAVTSLVPMPEQFRKAILVVAVVAVVLYALSFFGLLDADWGHYHRGR
jgi:Co/Zn/Cd efflux system component